MKYELYTLHRPAADVCVPQVTADEFDLVGDGRQVFGMARREVVDHPHAMTQREQPLDDV